MARNLFGGTIADWTFSYGAVDLVGDVTGTGLIGILQQGGATVLFYSAETGGTQYTDLQSSVGAAIDSVTSSDGTDGRAVGQLPPFFGPDGIWQMWASAEGGPRVRMGALVSVGTVAGTLAAGDDARFADASTRTGGGKEAIASVTATGAATTVNLAGGNTQTVTLNASTTLTLSGATASTSCTLSLYVVQGTGGGRLITWPASVKWPAATAPTLSTAVGARDLIVLETLDGGTNWFCSLAALDFR